MRTELQQTATLGQAEPQLAAMAFPSTNEEIVESVCAMNWAGLNRSELLDSAWIYYYFSIQFRENLEIALRLFPEDQRLRELDGGERDTDNLSPCPGVVAAGERVDHDEFMLRALQLEEIDPDRRRRLQEIGEAYLRKIRSFDLMTRASSLSSYEAGGLEKVFTAILRARNWDGPALAAYKHFLVGHIALDSDAEHGHGALCEHLKPGDKVPRLWQAFRDSLVAGVPALIRD